MEGTKIVFEVIYIQVLLTSLLRTDQISQTDLTKTKSTNIDSGFFWYELVIWFVKTLISLLYHWTDLSIQYIKKLERLARKKWPLNQTETVYLTTSMFTKFDASSLGIFSLKEIKLSSTSTKYIFNLREQLVDSENNFKVSRTISTSL
jgi:hypothetical protein